ATLVEQGTVPAATFVDLTVSGCPAGASCSFSPTSRITPTNSTSLFIGTPPTIPPVTYPLPITATGGGTTKTTTMTLVVKNLEFALTAEPPTRTFPPFPSTTLFRSATLVEQGTVPVATFVDLTVSGCPTGASCVFSPSSRITPTNSTSLFVATPATIPAGSYPLTITRSEERRVGKASRTRVSKNPEKALTADPPTRTLLPCFTVDYAIPASLVNEGPMSALTFVDLTVSGCPTGASCVFSPSSRITPTNSTSLFVATPATIPAGSYPLTITRSEERRVGKASRTRVSKNPEKALTADPPTRTLLPCFTVDYAIPASLVNEGPMSALTFVDLTVSGCPTGASCVFSPSSRITPTNSTSLFVATPATIPAGSYPLTITATGGGTTKTTTVTLVVKNLRSEERRVGKARRLLPGFTPDYNITATLVEQGTIPAATHVAAYDSAWPLGSSRVFCRSSRITPTNSTSLFVTTPATIPAGSYPLTITATGGGTTKTTTVTLVVKNL